MNAPQNPLADELARELNEQFVQQFGPILSSEVLVKGERPVIPPCLQAIAA